MTLLLFATVCTTVQCGPISRIGTRCNTSFDCGFELECLAVDPDFPDDLTCEKECTETRDCEEVFGRDTGVICMDPAFGFEVTPPQTGLCKEQFDF